MHKIATARLVQNVLYIIIRCVIAAGLTAAMEGFLSSPAGGWVTSAPMNITGDWNTAGLMGGREGGKQNDTSHFKLSKAKNVRHSGNKVGTAMGFKLGISRGFTTFSQRQG